MTTDDNSPEDQPTPSDVVAHSGPGDLEKRLEESSRNLLIPVEFLAKFLRDTASRTLPTKSKTYARPFFVDEGMLRTLDKRVRNAMREVSEDEVAVIAEVGYADLSSETFNGLEECFENAAEETQPERLGLTWTAVSSAGVFHEVQMWFITEKPLESEVTRIPDPEAAHISLQVRGESRRWVRSTFNALEPVVKNSRLSFMFRPLELLRDNILRHIMSWIMGAAAFYASFEFLRKRTTERNEAQSLKTILEGTTVDQRFERFVREFYSPDDSFLLGLVAFLIPYGLLFAVQLIAFHYLAHLVPRSSVNVGITARHYAEYINVFKFVVFTVIFGTILGVLVNLLSDVIS